MCYYYYYCCSFGRNVMKMWCAFLLFCVDGQYDMIGSVREVYIYLSLLYFQLLFKIIGKMSLGYFIIMLKISKIFLKLMMMTQKYNNIFSVHNKYIIYDQYFFNQLSSNKSDFNPLEYISPRLIFNYYFQRDCFYTHTHTNLIFNYFMLKMDQKIRLFTIGKYQI